MYVRLNNRIAVEIIPDTDPELPDFPIEKRYPKEFLQKCVHVPDNTNVIVGMEYDANTNSFVKSLFSDNLLLKEQLADLQNQILTMMTGG